MKEASSDLRPRVFACPRARFFSFLVASGRVRFMRRERATEYAMRVRVKWVHVTALVVVSHLFCASGVFGGGDDSEPSVQFFLPLLDASPGETLEVPFQLRTDSPLSMISLSVEFESDAFEFIGAALAPDVLEIVNSHENYLFESFLEPEEDFSEFDTPLGANGDQVVPPVASSGRADANFEFGDGKLSYRLRARNVENITQVTLHLGAFGENGPTVAVLAEFPGEGITVGDDKTEFAETELKSSDVSSIAELGFDGSLEALAARMEAGEAYIVVHTNRHPNGELRGPLGRSEEEQWVQISLVTDFQGREEFSIPPTNLSDIVTLTFRVLDDATEGEYELEFSVEGEATYEGNFDDGEKAVFNVVRPAGSATDPSSVTLQSDSVDVTNGLVFLSIIGDIQILKVGDTNADGNIDVSDSVRILDSTFGSGVELACLSAADVNADGFVDVSDAVRLLLYLFSGTIRWAPTEVSSADPIDPGPSCFRRMNGGE